MSGIPLLCLPHAGAGASFFWPWQRANVPGLTVMPVQLPGREDRIDEEPYTSIPQAAAGIAADLRPLLHAHSEIAIFGHSLGAALAYELAQRLRDHPGTRVAQLFVSGSPGPAEPRSRRATGLGDDEFLARIQEFAGHRHPAFDIPELRELILPTLRADVAMHEAHHDASPEPLTVPITCFRGSSDELVSLADMATWRTATTARCEFIERPGGHMYLVQDADALLHAMAGRMQSRLSA